jgi:hypothetical protein
MQAKVAQAVVEKEAPERAVTPLDGPHRRAEQRVTAANLASVRQQSGIGGEPIWEGEERGGLSRGIG